MPKEMIPVVQGVGLKDVVTGWKSFRGLKADIDGEQVTVYDPTNPEWKATNGWNPNVPKGEATSWYVQSGENTYYGTRDIRQNSDGSTTTVMNYEGMEGQGGKQPADFSYAVTRHPGAEGKPGYSDHEFTLVPQGGEEGKQTPITLKIEGAPEGMLTQKAFESVVQNLPRNPDGTIVLGPETGKAFLIGLNKNLAYGMQVEGLRGNIAGVNFHIEGGGKDAQGNLVAGGAYVYFEKTGAEIQTKGIQLGYGQDGSVRVKIEGANGKTAIDLQALGIDGPTFEKRIAGIDTSNLGPREILLLAGIKEGALRVDLGAASTSLGGSMEVVSQIFEAVSQDQKGATSVFSTELFLDKYAFDNHISRGTMTAINDALVTQHGANFNDGKTVIVDGIVVKADYKSVVESSGGSYQFNTGDQQKDAEWKFYKDVYAGLTGGMDLDKELGRMAMGAKYLDVEMKIQKMKEIMAKGPGTHFVFDLGRNFKQRSRTTVQTTGVEANIGFGSEDQEHGTNVVIGGRVQKVLTRHSFLNRDMNANATLNTKHWETTANVAVETNLGKGVYIGAYGEAGMEWGGKVIAAISKDGKPLVGLPVYDQGSGKQFIAFFQGEIGKKMGKCVAKMEFMPGVDDPAKLVQGDIEGLVVVPNLKIQGRAGAFAFNLESGPLTDVVDKGIDASISFEKRFSDKVTITAGLGINLNLENLKDFDARIGPYLHGTYGNVNYSIKVLDLKGGVFSVQINGVTVGTPEVMAAQIFEMAVKKAAIGTAVNIFDMRSDRRENQDILRSIVASAKGETLVDAKVLETNATDVEDVQLARKFEKLNFEYQSKKGTDEGKKIFEEMSKVAGKMHKDARDKLVKWDQIQDGDVQTLREVEATAEPKHGSRRDEVVVTDFQVTDEKTGEKKTVKLFVKHDYGGAKEVDENGEITKHHKSETHLKLVVEQPDGTFKESNVLLQDVFNRVDPKGEIIPEKFRDEGWAKTLGKEMLTYNLLKQGGASKDMLDQLEQKIQGIAKKHSEVDLRGIQEFLGMKDANPEAWAADNVRKLLGSGGEMDHQQFETLRELAANDPSLVAQIDRWLELTKDGKSFPVPRESVAAILKVIGPGVHVADNKEAKIAA